MQIVFSSRRDLEAVGGRGPIWHEMAAETILAIGAD
jgi:hypothetical protein